VPSLVDKVAIVTGAFTDDGTARLWLCPFRANIFVSTAGRPNVIATRIGFAGH
jgi:hypothetical protein